MEKMNSTTTEQMCPDCGRVFLEKDQDGLYCRGCGDYVSKADAVAAKRDYICPDDECGGKLVYDDVNRAYKCMGVCGVSWGVSSIESRKKCSSFLESGKMIGC